MVNLGLKNLTSGDQKHLAEIGITTKAQFEKLGAEKIHLLLHESGLKLDDTLIYRLRGAERDIDWQILADRAKRRAKSRFADVDEP
jgi:hypothetical protein